MYAAIAKNGGLINGIKARSSDDGRRRRHRPYRRDDDDDYRGVDDWDHHPGVYEQNNTKERKIVTSF